MADPDDDTKTKLKKLRNRLAFEAPRARARQSASPELIQRLQSALELVDGVYRLTTTPMASLDEIYEDALVEGHLALSEWERRLEQDKQQKSSPRTPPPIDRRRHERHETNVSVRLLRHSLRDDGSGGVSLESETTSRPARNISLGGIFVAVARNDVAQVGVGNVVRISVSTSLAPSLSFSARAAVSRRDDEGIALAWIEDSPGARQSIESLLDAIGRSRVGRRKLPMR